MGMDVYGFAPRSLRGAYFRDNIWEWHPLWDFCCKIAPDVIKGDKALEGHENGHYGLGGADAVMLGRRIDDAVADGRAEEHAEWFRSHGYACWYCGTTVGRTAVVALLTDSEDAIRFARDLLPEGGAACPACTIVDAEEARTGVTRPKCRFRVENAIRFRDFLADCGGFEIH